MYVTGVSRPAALHVSWLPSSRLLRSASTVIAVAVLALTTGLSLPTHASCAAFSPAVAVAGAEVLFVGFATANRERGAYTKFSVEEVWKGPNLAPTVWVQGGQDQGPWPLNNFIAVASGNDVRFEVGERYLVAADAQTFRTHDCTAPQPFEPSLRQYAPVSIRGPTGEGLSGASAPPSLLLLNTVAILVIVGLALAGVLVGLRQYGKRI